MNKYKRESRKAQCDRRACRMKRRYDSEDEARQKGQEHYKCPHCSGWHRSGSLSRLVAKARNIKL